MPGQTPEGATSVSFEDQNVLGFQPYTQPAPNPTEILSIFSGTAVLMFDGYVPGAVQFCSFEIPQDPEGTPYTLLDDPQHGLPVRLTGIAYPLNPPGVSFLYQRVRQEISAKLHSRWPTMWQSPTTNRSCDSKVTCCEAMSVNPNILMVEIA
jgi:hypothetical protein